MRHLKLQLHRLGVVQISILLLIIGLFFGILFANLFRNSYDTQMLQYQNNVFTEITANEIDYPGLFRYVLAKNLNEFVVFWLLCITILGIPYMAYKIISFGFFTGFFISEITMQYGFKGILLILVYAFPQGLLYLPIALVSLYKGYGMCKSIYRDNRSHMSGLTKSIKPNLIVILILAIVLVIGSFLEAYVGAFLLKKTLGMFT